MARLRIPPTPTPRPLDKPKKEKPPINDTYVACKLSAAMARSSYEYAQAPSTALLVMLLQHTKTTSIHLLQYK